MNQIYELKTLEELSDYLKNENTDEIRQALIKTFDKLSHYKNAEEWNKLVRVCEALAIIGWGEREPLEAIEANG